MSQENQGANSTAQEPVVPVKRKRGRPRKDENVVHGEKSSSTPEVDTAKRNRRRRIDPVANAENALVGQMVSGVLDGSFDAGYLLTVRVGNTNTILRGIVFEPGLSVPISGANDVAPNVKMYKRNEIAIPVVTTPNPVPVFTSQSRPKKDRPVKIQKIETNHVSPVVLKKSQSETKTETSSPLISKGRPDAGSQIDKGKSVDILQKNESTIPPGGVVGDANHALKIPPKAIQSELNSKKAVRKDVPSDGCNQPIPVATEAMPSVDKTEKPVEVLQGNERKGHASDVGAPKDLKVETKTEQPPAKIVPNAIDQENNASPRDVSTRAEVTHSVSMDSVDIAKEDVQPMPKTDQTAETLQREAIPITQSESELQKASEPQKIHPTRPTKVDNIVSKETISTLQAPSELGVGPEKVVK